jgi:hypothetical protein
MAILKSLLTLLLEALGPLLKEVIFDAFKNTVEESSPDVALRERLLRRVRDANDSAEGR